jgi:hypothetical protein
MYKIINFKNILKDNYRIYDNGLILNKKGKKILGTIDNKGYVRVYLKLNNGKQKYFRLHILMAYHYITKKLKGFTVNHKNGKKDDNTKENLEVITNIGNVIHAKLNNLIPNCENTHNSKFTNDQVHLICKYLENGDDYDYIVSNLNLNDSKKVRVALSRIKRRISYYEISKNYKWKSKKFDKFMKLLSNRYIKFSELINILDEKDNSSNRDIYRNIFYELYGDEVQRLSKLRVVKIKRIS